MSTRSKVAASLTSAGIVALGWHQFAGVAPSESAPTATTTVTTTATTTVTAQPSASASSSTAASQATSSATSAAAASGFKDGTYTGQTVQYRYGQLSITVTISGGKITSVSENIQSDGERRSEMINSQAVPMLRSEVLQANSAQVQTIGGGTYTSEAYLQSLQSALDQA